MAVGDVTIDAVFFAQTHVLQPGAPFFKLVGNKETLIKVHVLSASGAAAPSVEAELRLDGDVLPTPEADVNGMPEEPRVLYAWRDS